MILFSSTYIKLNIAQISSSFHWLRETITFICSVLYDLLISNHCVLHGAYFPFFLFVCVAENDT